MTGQRRLDTAKPRILLDCDPGHDDAIAIVAAARHAELVGITTVAGNAPLDRTTYNALVMRDLLGIDVPGPFGERSARWSPSRSSPPFVHGESGLDGADLPAPTTPLDGTDAVGFIVDTCRATEGIWLVPIGPLTNIALALRSAPDLVERIAGISLMGGGTFGNRSSGRRVQHLGRPGGRGDRVRLGGRLVMAGLDVTHQFQATPRASSASGTIPGTLAEVLADLFVFFAGTYLGRHDAGSIDGAAGPRPARRARADASRHCSNACGATSWSRRPASSPAG